MNEYTDIDYPLPFTRKYKIGFLLLSTNDTLDKCWDVDSWFEKSKTSRSKSLEIPARLATHLSTKESNPGPQTRDEAVTIIKRPVQCYLLLLISV